ncbi:TRAP transporter large permease [Roseovarius sp.]|uniref:TRAP transporter large permease n=1 Tax=Roseovarius sp. TaxID=1486281 RepID=UPI003A982C18
MDPLLLGLIIILAILLPAALGLPIGIAMTAVSLVGMWSVTGEAFMMTTAQTMPYAVGSDFAFVVVPMFILMGAITSATGITSELYTAAHRWTSGVRGGLYYATTLAAGGFGAINGSTVVSSTVFTRIALPEMIRFGYSKAISAGCICAAGTFAALIPPSLAMVIYGIITEESVGRLLMAGLVPGLLTIGVYFIGMGLLIYFRPEVAPQDVERFTLSEKLVSLKGLWAILLLVAIVMGGIYSGIMFPSTAGAAGAGGAVLISLFRNKLTGQDFWNSLKETAMMTAVLFLIIIGGLLLSRLLLVSGILNELTSLFGHQGMSVAWFLTLSVFVFVLLGMFVDGVSMLVMTVPFLHPISQSLGMDPIWFGVIVVKLVEIGAITPPVGLNLFAVIAASEGKVDARETFRGVLPFIGMEIVTLLLIIWFPQISIWLPDLMFN